MLQQAARTASAASAFSLLVVSRAFSQARLAVSKAAHLVAQHAPAVNPGTLVAFDFHESRRRPWAIHNNTTGQTYFPASLAGAVAFARSQLQQGHSLDLGITQGNSANMARTGLTVASAFDPAKSMRAGATILIAAYQ